MSEQQKQQAQTKRELAREDMHRTLGKLVSNAALTAEAVAHYTDYLATSKAVGEKDMMGTSWDPKHNHRAKLGDPSAIDGTHAEMLVEAALFTSSGVPIDRVYDNQMQRYGQDFIHGNKKYSVKNREHEITPFKEYVIDLRQDDFKPGLFRVHKIVFVDRRSQLMTIISYRELCKFCCTQNEKNINIALNVPRLFCADFEHKYPGTVETYDLRDFGWDL